MCMTSCSVSQYIFVFRFVLASSDQMFAVSSVRFGHALFTVDGHNAICSLGYSANGYYYITLALGVLRRCEPEDNGDFCFCPSVGYQNHIIYKLYDQ